MHVLCSLKTGPDYGQGMNPISRLAQIQQAKKEKEPEYQLLSERGMPRRREFVMQVTNASHFYFPVFLDVCKFILDHNSARIMDSGGFFELAGIWLVNLTLV